MVVKSLFRHLPYIIYKYVIDVVYICQRKIDPQNIGLLSKVNVEEWKKIIEKCIVTNGIHLYNLFIIQFSLNIVSVFKFHLEATNQEVELNTELLYLITAYCERVLTNPRGCLLLVGRSGIGRNLAVRIVASRHNATVVSPKIRPVFNLNAFKNDIKTVFHTDFKTRL